MVSSLIFDALKHGLVLSYLSDSDPISCISHILKCPCKSTSFNTKYSNISLSRGIFNVLDKFHFHEETHKMWFLNMWAWSIDPLPQK